MSRQVPPGQVGADFRAGDEQFAADAAGRGERHVYGLFVIEQAPVTPDAERVSLAARQEQDALTRLAVPGAGPHPPLLVRGNRVIDDDDAADERPLPGKAAYLVQPRLPLRPLRGQQGSAAEEPFI